MQWLLPENNIFSLIMHNRWALELFFYFHMPESGQICKNFYIFLFSVDKILISVGKM